MLHVIEYGTQGTLPPILIAHGLYGSARNWGAIARRLATDRRVLAVDMRNHGESFRAETHGYDDLAADLAAVVEDRGGPVDLIGHSMGGKAAMMLALGRPDLVNRLIIGDISPVAYGHTQLPLAQAMQAMNLDGIDTRAEADRRLAASVDDPSVRAFLLQSLDLKGDRPRWRLNLPVLEREMPKIMGWPEQSSTATMPVLVLAGGNSDYVRPEHRPVIRRLFPEARLARLPGAGHWLHADRPREFEATIRAFFH